MLDARADFRFRIVGPPRRLVDSAAFRLLAMDVADEAIPVQERLVGRRSVSGIGPHPARSIALVEQALAVPACFCSESIQPEWNQKCCRSTRFLEPSSLLLYFVLS